MKHDELIDDVAREMTAVDGRSALRGRVLSALENARRPRPAYWVSAAAVGAMAILLVWAIHPSSTDEHALSTFVPSLTSAAPKRGETVSGHVAGVTSGDTSPGVEPKPSPQRMEPAVAVAGTRSNAKNAVALAIMRDSLEQPRTPAVPYEDSTEGIPTIAPLTGPAPVVVEPITLIDVAMEPLHVKPIEVRSLIVEPLAPSVWNGVPARRGT